MRKRESLSRRDFLKMSTVTLPTVSLTPSLHLQRTCGAENSQPEAHAPIRLSAGPHLFIDDHLIAEHKGLKRTINQPRRLPHPVVTGPEDKCFQPYLTVLRDPKTGRFRIWYGVPESANQSHVGYLESNDGIHWERPHRVLEDAAKIQFGVSILDDGRDELEPAQRYKYGWYGDGGLMLATSPDGLRWTLLKPGAVLRHNHDINNIFRDSIRCRYGANVSTYGEGPTWTGKRRVTMQSYSTDLIHWSRPRYIITPDQHDEGETQFYGMGGVIARGNLLIGMVRVLRDDLPAELGGPVAGLGYTTLAWSRDGNHWTRDRDPFLPRNPQRGAWDRAMAWVDCQLPVGDDVYVYYGGYARGHKVERFTERQIGLAIMKRDRFVSRDAGSEGGILRTRRVAFDAAHMAVNAKVDGEMRIRILDGAGEPLKGFHWAERAPIWGDSVAHRVGWENSLATLRGRTVRLEFALRQAQFYGFELLK